MGLYSSKDIAKMMNLTGLIVNCNYLLSNADSLLYDRGVVGDGSLDIADSRVVLEARKSLVEKMQMLCDDYRNIPQEIRERVKCVDIDKIFLYYDIS